MSIQAVNRVVEHSEMRLGARLVLIAIAWHQTEDGGAYPSIERLMRECRMSERAVRYALRTAEKAEELHTEMGAGPHGTNLYTVTVQAKETEGQILPGADTRAKLAPNSNKPKALKNLKAQPSASEYAKALEATARELAALPRVEFEAREHEASQVFDRSVSADQVYLAKRITDHYDRGPAWFAPAAVQKLNNLYGTARVTSVMRTLHGFPPEALDSAYAYVDHLARGLTEAEGGDAKA